MGLEAGGGPSEEACGPPRSGGLHSLPARGGRRLSTRSGLSGKASQRKRNELRLQDGGNGNAGGGGRGRTVEEVALSRLSLVPHELGPGGGRVATLWEVTSPT